MNTNSRKTKKFNDNGDLVARALRGHHDDLFEFANEFGLPKNLRTKYRKLNHGQQRMLVGIRLRTALKNDPTLKAKLRAALH